MAASRKPTRTVHVPRTAISSSAKIRDFLELGKWLFIAFRLLILCIKHWYILGMLLAYFFLGWWASVAILLLIPVVIIGYVWLNNRHHTFTAACRATYYFMYSRRKWRWACEKAQINDGPHVPRLISFIHRRPPKIVNERGTALEFVLNLQRVGITVQLLEENVDYITSALSARRTRVVRLTPGIARVNIEWEKSIGKPGSSMGRAVSDVLLPRVELDTDVLLELETSLLVVGKSGTGKSNLTWFMLNELNKLRVNYKLYVLDPKRVELQELIDSPHVMAYEDDLTELDRVIDKFYEEMMATYERMKPQHLRRAPLGPDWPLHLLIIDEILMCAQARTGAIDSNLAKVLISGRAAGFIVIADSQLGQVDALTRLRDLFPQRICMAVQSDEMVNAVLGPRCAEKGARCTEISEPGVGYIFTDFAGAFMRFKIAFIQGVSQVAAGQVWTPVKKKRRRQTGACYTYWLYNYVGSLMYIGIGFNPAERIAQHVDKPWFKDIDYGRTVIKKYDSEKLAREAETRNIEEMRPIYNIVGNHKKSA